ncbi:unnamed protein product [Rotaria magnacalcarata]|uniref:Ubiquitin-like domain-containing protein n=4 Tax=Rotaria magnacalcarata TaxID=392030 RepID=A0A816CZW7_9BILA|nr:unnamed protein product [Rotaria magnacalcarata]CAF5210228.1 unnamed protein product [Rotaria magnacalcarata]
MPRLTAFYIKLQLHFGGDIHEVCVSATDGIEPTVADLMNVLETSFRVPRALPNIVFQGQELHGRPNDPLSRFGIRNGVPIRLVGRMVPPDKVDQLNNHYGNYAYQQPYYTQPLNTTTTFPSSTQYLPYYHEQIKYLQRSSNGTQYDPPPPSVQHNQSFPIFNLEQTSESSNGEEYKP